MANPTMSLIASKVISTNTSSVAFSSIPNTYTDLKLIVSTRDNLSSGNSTALTVFNSDTSTNYTNVGMYINGTSVSNLINSTSVSQFPWNVSTSTTGANYVYTYGEMYIPNYNSTAGKPYIHLSTGEGTSSWIFLTAAGRYTGSSGITSISLTPASGASFVSGSSFYLYGIKNS